MVPNDWPVIVCVIPATGVIVTPRQGSGGGGGGGGAGVVSDFEQPAKKTVSIIAEQTMFLFILFNCTINLVFKNHMD